MPNCQNCSSPLPAGSRSCASCGRPVPLSSELQTENLVPGDHPDELRAGPTHFAPTEARFLPGVVLAGRYRIIGLLGKGGMGEVYRADDLKLGQPVALKFLSPGFDAQPDRLRRLLDEVRTARQVSHSSVCRIYDVGEADGQHFLSMEYVDGEDLASLLRRIGRLPKDKAIQIARQLCAGLAASHEVGVLHRDLKPANIMIDGRGRARITDFGLAGFAAEIGGEEIRAGTPVYMAPEQFAGRSVSARSDIYSLGLVLYELFTGKPAFKGASLEEQRRLQSETTPSSPSSLVEGFDPMVERVILRCLEADPARRPPSALAVAAALPGGDPLAAALAAGETPSPEMVAEAGEKHAASPLLAWGGLAIFIAALCGSIALASRTTLLGMIALDKPPEVLRERARELLAMAGRDRKPTDSLFTFEADHPALESLVSRDASGRPPWEVLRSAPPSGVRFWYRESPRPLHRMAPMILGDWMIDPPFQVPGMARIGLDPDGRLVSLLVVPGERTSAEPAPSKPDWAPLLRATGVDPSSLSPVVPEWAPPVFADGRDAWTGYWPGQPDLPLRIEGAALGGQPVSLRLLLPWDPPAEALSGEEGQLPRRSLLLRTVWYLAVITTAGVVALRNVRRGRGDRRGALRFALYLGALRMVWYLGAHHIAALEELELFMAHFSFAMQRVGLAYIFYLAIEPYARRLWPRMLVSWVRVLEGRFHDPLVGRDLLLGAAGGAFSVMLGRLQAWVPESLGGPGPLPTPSDWVFEPLRGAVPAFVSVIGVHTQELLGVIFPLTLLLILRLLLRRTGPAIGVVSLLAMVMFYPGSGNIPLYVIGLGIGMATAWLLLFRVGLLAFATMVIVMALIEQMPLVPRPADWYLGATLLALAFIAAPALYGFWTSQAGRPLFNDRVLEPEPQR